MALLIYLSQRAPLIVVGCDELKECIVRIVLAILVTVTFQQWYACTQECGVEQPIGPIGIGEFLFRHPEQILGLHFAYPIHK